MRSFLARAVAFTALFPFGAAVWSFTERADLQRDWVNPDPGDVALVRFANDLSTPAFLLAFAAIIEMLCRIAERLPVEPQPASGYRRKPWQSRIAKLLVVAALVGYVATAVSYLALQSQNAGPDHGLGVFLAVLVRALVEPVWLIALAAGVEYLSRIAARWNPDAE